MTEDEERRLKMNSPTAGIEKQTSIYQSIVDMEIHGPGQKSISEIVAEVSDEHAVFDGDSYSMWWSRFSHYRKRLQDQTSIKTSK